MAKEKKVKDKVFDLPVDSTPAADKMARGFKAEANQMFSEQTEKAEDLVRRVWYRNTDNEGEPSLERVEKLDENDDPIPNDYVTDEPTGLEIMAAFGVDAESIWALATARAVMLGTLAAQLKKPDIIDAEALAGPYTLTFKPDGSLDEATPR